MGDQADGDCLREFAEEAREHIVALNRDLLELEDGGAEAPAELVNNVFRAVHTIKGLSGMLGLASINGLAHTMEDALSAVRQGEALVQDSLAQALFDSLDLLAEMVEEAARGAVSDRDTQDAADKLTAAVDEARGPATSTAGEPAEQPDASASAGPYASQIASGMSVYTMALSFKRDFRSSKKRMLAALARLGEVGEVIRTEPGDLEARLRSRRSMAPDGVRLTIATTRGRESIREAMGVEGLELDGPSGPGGASADADDGGPSGQGRRGDASGTRAEAPERTAAPAADAIRVDVAKLDRVLALVGELVILRSRYNHLADSAISGLAGSGTGSRNVIALQSELNEVESAMSRALGELQDAVMKARLVPLGTVFGRFRRAVRDTAARAGKAVRFESSGGETELDKKVIDQIGDPILHLIRNAVDHGIEGPGRRRGLGKPEEGCVSLRARHEGDRIVIEVGDDGGGVDREAVIRRAVERGVLASADSASVSGHELLEIMSAPGFSTSERVTDVSGRGVGLDVVKQALASLKGTLEMAGEPGQGTTFRIRLPLTMAIVDALLVAVGRECYAIAVGSVKEIVELSEGDVYLVGGRECSQVKGRVLPVVRLTSALGGGRAARRSGEGELLTAVVADSGEGAVALAVDRVIGQQEIVIKALSRRFEQVAEISGGSVLGDGSICLILDVPALVAKAQGELAGTVGAVA